MRIRLTLQDCEMADEVDDVLSHKRLCFALQGFDYFSLLRFFFHFSSYLHLSVNKSPHTHSCLSCRLFIIRA